MKVNIVLYEQEGFLQEIGIVLENGLKLRTYARLPWAGKLEREKIQDHFKEFINELESRGFEIINKDGLSQI